MESLEPVDRKAWWIGSSTSPQMRSFDVMKQSRVWLTMPSVLFSTGTTPQWAAPDSTSRNTSSMAAWARVVAKCPNCLMTAASV